MIGDIVIILLAIATGWAVYKLFIMETKYTVSRFCLGLILITVLIGGILAPNKDLINGLFTPELNGIVLDYETGKPLANVDVVVDWGYEFSDITMHSTKGSYVKSIHVKTDANGKFYAPSRYKSLAIMLFPLYHRTNSSSGVTVFNLDYEVIDSRRSDKTTTLILKRITDFDRLTMKYKDFELFERYGSKEGKALASVYKANFDLKQKEFIRNYGISKDVFDRIYGR